MKQKYFAYWQRFWSWFKTEPLLAKITLLVIAIFLLQGKWQVSFLIALIWWFIDKAAQAKRKKIEKAITEAKSYLAPIIVSKTLPIVIALDLQLQKDERCCYEENNG